MLGDADAEAAIPSGEGESAPVAETMETPVLEGDSGATTSPVEEGEFGLDFLEDEEEKAWPVQEPEGEPIPKLEAEAPAEAVLDVEPEPELEPGPGVEVASVTPEVVPTPSRAGLSLGPAKSKRQKVEVTEPIDEAEDVLSSVKPRKPKNGKKQPAKQRAPKQKQQRPSQASGGDSLDFAYATSKLRGGNTLSLVFVLGMLMAVAVSVGAGFVLSDFIQTLLLPMGV